MRNCWSAAALPVLRASACPSDLPGSSGFSLWPTTAWTPPLSELKRPEREVLVSTIRQRSEKGFALRHGFEHALAHGAEAVMVVDADSIVSRQRGGPVQSAFIPAVRVAQCRYEMFSTTDRSSTRLAALAFAAST
jgi:cellulose synthase/poly-beta-1,6-N-acetylglucosamine synthase-like glycosyltransferase